MNETGERITTASICAALGLMITFVILMWVDDLPLWAFIAVPAACALAGFLAGHRAVEVFQDIVDKIYC
jgi:hypothetical protein